MTQRVAPTQQGQLQGAVQSLQGVAAIIGPILFGETFAWSIRNDATLHMPGLAIYLSSSLLVIALLVAWGVAHPHRREAPAIA